MAVRAEQTSDPGLGQKYLGKSKRVINRDGTFNVRRDHTGDFFRDSYKWLIEMSWARFLGLIFGLYLLLNTFFAIIYLIIELDSLQGVPPSSNGLDAFLHAFYFSIETFTAVGYGAISPMGRAAGLVSSLEALIGLMGFALATGLLYGRFSHPQAQIGFSKVAVVSPFQEGTALMFRIVNMRHNVLMEMEATVIFKEEVMVDGHVERRYHRLNLTLDKVTFFPMNWTLVHPIDEESPFYGRTSDEIAQRGGEVLVLLKGFDESFSQTVYARYSYTGNEIEFGRRFERMFYTNDAGDVVVETAKLSNTQEV